MRRIRLMSSLTLAAVLAAGAGSLGAQTLSLN